MKKGTKIAIGVLTGGVALAVGAVVKIVKDKLSNNNDEAEAEYSEVNDQEEIEDSENSEEETSEE